MIKYRNKIRNLFLHIYVLRRRMGNTASASATTPDISAVRLKGHSTKARP